MLPTCFPSTPHPPTFTSIRNNRTTSHRKRTHYRLSSEMNTGRNSKQTTCLCRDTGGKGTLPAQHTSFNTLDNWGHKTPTQSKRKRTEKKRLNGHGPEHVYNTLGYIHFHCHPIFIHLARLPQPVPNRSSRLRGRKAT